MNRLRAFGAVVIGSLVFGAPSLARAVEYEVFVDIDEEDDLFDLNQTGQISDQTFEDLQDLLRRGVNLETASRAEIYSLPNLTYSDVDRILAYREEAGGIGDPASLVAADVLSERVLRSIAAFLLVPDPDRKIGVRGYARYRTVWTAEDDRVPPMALEARVSTARHLTLGVALLLDRNRVAPVTYDPNRDGLITDGPRTQVRPAKYFAMWDTPKWGIVAGTYSIGFGQRLVFDTTGRYTPNGFYFDNTVNRKVDLVSECRETAGELTDTPCPQDAPRTYVTPDFNIRENLRGVAAGFKHAHLPKGYMQGYGFFSFQTKSLWQYDAYRPDRCDDPNSSIDECRAIEVYRRPDGDPLGPASGLRSTTLPNMYNEIVGGANFTYFYNRRIHVGVTGYGATTQWLVEGVELDFQESARLPYGGPFGAVGADAAWGKSWADLFLEVAYSVDNMFVSETNTVDPQGGGGPAAILRHVATWGRHEVEVSARYYDEDFANPFARPIAAGDEIGGLRARGEAGGRIRYNGTILERWNLRTFFDVWATLDQNTPKLQAYIRNDVQVLDWLRPGVWLDYQNQDLANNGRTECYTGTENDFDEDGLGFDEVFRCRGERIRFTGRLRFDPHKRVNFTLQYAHTWRDQDGLQIEYTGSVGDFSLGDFGDVVEAVDFYDENFRQDANAALIFNTNPIDPLRIRTRVRWQSDELEFRDRGESTIWAYIDVKYTIRRWLAPSVRYDIRQWLDERESTSFRRPNPEHWLYFQLESRF